MYVRVSDQELIFVEIVGEGEPFVFIHGGPGAWSENFAFFWKQKEHPCQMIFIDQRGCGRSSGNLDSDFSLQRIIQDFEEIREFLKISSWSLLAHSFGGILATLYASNFKRNIHKLCLCNCTLSMKDSIESQLLFFKKNNFFISYLNNEENIIEVWKKFLENQEDGFYEDMLYKINSTSSIVKEIDAKSKNISMAQQAFLNKEYFQDYYLHSQKVDCPVLVIVGKEDEAIGPSLYQKFLFPHQNVEWIQGKHVPFIEEKDDFYRIFYSFVDNV